jgi:tetratricopeptide (TPR) repeat protein
MKTLTLLLFSLFSLPLMLNAQTADEMLHKVTVAIEAGQHGQAVSYFRQAISLNIDRSEMFYWTSIDKSSEISSKLSNELALAYKKNRNYDKAFLFYKELSQKDPDNVDYLEAVAEMQVCRGQEKDALRMYENILKLDADNLAANIFLGNYYYLMAEQEKKKLESDKKLSSPTKMQYARYRDGLSKLFATGYEKARSSLQKVVLRFPSTEAQKTLDKILRIEKEVNR